MTDLFSVTAPLAIRFPNGEKQIMVELLAWHGGLLFLPPFWMESPVEQTMRFVPGPIKGEGPWKIGDAVVTVLGCHGTDPELADLFACWQSFIAQAIGTYPDRSDIEQLMRAHAEHVIAAGTK
jgi:hypothetical protein